MLNLLSSNDVCLPKRLHPLQYLSLLGSICLLAQVVVKIELDDSQKSKKQTKNLRNYPVIGLLQEMRNLFLGKIKILKASKKEKERERTKRDCFFSIHQMHLYFLKVSLKIKQKIQSHLTKLASNVDVRQIIHNWLPEHSKYAPFFTQKYKTSEAYKLIGLWHWP